MLVKPEISGNVGNSGVDREERVMVMIGERERERERESMVICRGDNVIIEKRVKIIEKIVEKIVEMIVVMKVERVYWY